VIQGGTWSLRQESSKLWDPEYLSWPQVFSLSLWSEENGLYNLKYLHIQRD
jgi:hypothetical protein